MSSAFLGWGLYSSKDTFCSLYLSHGGRLKWLAEQTGVAEGTLRKHYAKYIRTAQDDAAELAKLRSRRKSAVQGGGVCQLVENGRASSSVN
jgi:hypothetical protein